MTHEDVIDRVEGAHYLFQRPEILDVPLILWPFASIALACPGTDPAACEALDFIEAELPLIRPDADRLGHRSSAVYARLLGITEDLAVSGCVAEVAWAGSYDRGTFTGNTQASEPVAGTYRRKELSGTVGGTSFGELLGTYGAGVLTADVADGFVVGSLLRTAGRSGVFFGLQSGTCVLDADVDEDGVPASTDCDDDDPTRFPGAPELCDGVDNDCDEDPSEDAKELDRDGDGFFVCDRDCDDRPGVGHTLTPPATCDGVLADCDLTCNPAVVAVEGGFGSRFEILFDPVVLDARPTIDPAYPDSGNESLEFQWSCVSGFSGCGLLGVDLTSPVLEIPPDLLAFDTIYSFTIRVNPVWNPSLATSHSIQLETGSDLGLL